MKKLKVAIVGCGFVAQGRHIPALKKLRRQVTISAVCDLNENLAKEVANRFSIPRIYTKLSDMLSKESLDVIDVCTPPQIHSSVAVEAIENGCNVVLEKPMASNLKDCDDMIRASKKNDTKLSIVHNQKFYPPFIKAEKLVNEGAIGKVMGVRTISLTSKDEYLVHEKHWIHKLPGGVIGETGPHHVYLSLAFLDSVNDLEVYAQKTSDYPWVLYDYYNIQLKGKSVSSSNIVSHASDRNFEEVDLLGTEGIIRVDLQSMILIRYGRKDLKPTSVARSSLSVANQIVKGVGSNVFSVLSKKSFLGHDIFMKKYIDSILNNNPVPVTPKEGKETVKVMEMIVKKLDQK